MENYENIPQNPIPAESAHQESIVQEPVPQEPVMQEPAPQEPVYQAPVQEPVRQNNPYGMPYPSQNPYAPRGYVPVTPVPPQPEKKSTGKKILRAVIAGAIAVGIFVTGCVATAYFGMQYMEKQNQESMLYMQQQIAALKQQIKDNTYTGSGNSISGTPVPAEGLTPGQIHAQNKNSVVGIANQSISTNIFGQSTEKASSGSGFIISSDGYIVTNHHVIEDATTLTVITNNEEEYEARVIGYDEKNDFALIKVDVAGLTPVTLGKSDDLIVGDQVVAIGNPLGEITNSLTVGYISVKDRDVTIENSVINMLQTDTAINPGNSGGPLFNMKGEVIGITTAKYSGDAVESIGFAIPIDDVMDMINDLLKDGYISAPYIGIQVTSDTDGVGVYVSSVESGSPAAEAGLKRGDVIVALGDRETPTTTELDKALRNYEPGDTAVIQVYRSRKILELTITFGSKYQPST